MANLNDKIYVVNSGSDTVSVFDPFGMNKKNIPVSGAVSGKGQNIAVSGNSKIYVANNFNGTVSVIDGDNDTKIGKIFVGFYPDFITSDFENSKIYVPNSDTVPVINGLAKIMDIPVQGFNIALDSTNNKIYVINRYNNTVSVIQSIDTKSMTNIVNLVKSCKQIRISDLLEYFT
jgi:YVTN family beta-propeller protein